MERAGLDIHEELGQEQGRSEVKGGLVEKEVFQGGKFSWAYGRFRWPEGDSEIDGYRIVSKFHNTVCWVAPIEMLVGLTVEGRNGAWCSVWKASG